jgi:hypothetical protein
MPATNQPDGRAGDDTDVPDDPRAIAIALISEIRNALVPARHDLAQADSDPARIELVRAAVQRVLNYATQCAERLDKL